MLKASAATVAQQMTWLSHPDNNQFATHPLRCTILQSVFLIWLSSSLLEGSQKTAFSVQFVMALIYSIIISSNANCVFNTAG
jgi:hypothetical protein